MGNDGNTADNPDVLSRLASVGEIAAGVAHEIRNPLTSVKGFLQLLQKEYEHKYWDIVFSELDQAIATVQSLLAVSKPSLQNETDSDFSLCAEMENVLSLFQQDSYRIQFEKRWYDKSTKVRGKRNQIKQALFNLVKNACEAIQNTGRIVVEHHRSDDFVQLSIADNGVGIPPEVLHRLGTPFFTTKPEGTGMGLTQVYTVLHENNATIKAQSTPGKGTTFILRFPISPLYKKDNGGIPQMKDIPLTQAQDVREFFRINREKFDELLEQQAQTTFQMVSQSKFVTKQDLLHHAYQITESVHDGLTQDIIEMAQELGAAWAKSDIPIISKMEWFYALRKVIWYFLSQFYSDKEMDSAAVFDLADRTSEALDNFIVHFNVSFTKYREDVLNSQKAMIAEMSVPIIPLFDSIGVFPIIGTLDTIRLQMIEERLLEQLEKSSMKKIFIDLSGAVVTDNIEIAILDRVLRGISLIGCEAVLTGVSARLARQLLNADQTLVNRITVQPTLQQALQQALRKTWKEKGAAVRGDVKYFV